MLAGRNGGNMEYYIYLSNNCNLHCDYCSGLADCKRKGIPITPQYSPEALEAFVEKTQKLYNDDNAVLIFFGGEPTLEYGRMEKIISLYPKSRDLEYAVRFVLHTNGILLDEMPEVVANRLDLVILSINYNHIPHYKLNEGYFAKITANVRALKKYDNLKVTSRLTVTEKSSLYYMTLLSEHLFDSVYWQIVNCNSFDDFESFYQTFTYETELTFAYWLKELEHGKMLPYIPFQHILRTLVSTEPVNEYFCCSYDSSQIYLQTDGKIYSCCDDIPEDIPAVGTMETGITFKHPKWSEYSICRECEYNYICRGRCGRMHTEISPQHVSEYCKMNIFLFNLFIENKERLVMACKAHPEYIELMKGWRIDIMELIP